MSTQEPNDELSGFDVPAFQEVLVEYMNKGEAYQQLFAGSDHPDMPRIQQLVGVLGAAILMDMRTQSQTTDLGYIIAIKHLSVLLMRSSFDPTMFQIFHQTNKSLVASAESRLTFIREKVMEILKERFISAVELEQAKQDPNFKPN